MKLKSLNKERQNSKATSLDNQSGADPGFKMEQNPSSVINFVGKKPTGRSKLANEIGKMVKTADGSDRSLERSNRSNGEPSPERQNSREEQREKKHNGHSKSRSDTWHVGVLDTLKGKLVRLGNPKKIAREGTAKSAVMRLIDHRLKRSFTKPENTSDSGSQRRKPSAGGSGEGSEKRRILEVLGDSGPTSGTVARKEKPAGKSFEVGQSRWKHYSESCVFPSSDRRI